jgi:SOS-response transcriptional repressor LexA
VNNFSRIGFVDIVVFNYNNRNKEPFIFVEVKKSGSGLSNCIEQLKSYMSTTKTCKYGIVSDGIEFMVLNREFQQEQDIPSFDSSMLPSSLEKYSYIDLNNNSQYDFMRDYDSKKEILVEDDKIYPVEDVIKLNIYENIAAGPPILINSTVEDEFYFPKKWLHNTDDCYMVKVKGNSMINANIDNGDIVIIKRQNIVGNYEIAAVDSDETLDKIAVDILD